MSRCRASVGMSLVGSLAVLLLCAPRACAAPASAAGDSVVNMAVWAYMKAIDAGDLERQMQFWSRDRGASSVIMGEMWTGAARIRARSAEYVPVSRRMRNEIGPITVRPLGDDYMLTITPYRPERRDPADKKLAPFELESVLTLIWTRTHDGWRILHEHVSVKVPPPATQ